MDKERRDWKIKQAEMVRQIADLQEECRSVTRHKKLYGYNKIWLGNHFHIVILNGFMRIMYY